MSVIPRRDGRGAAGAVISGDGAYRYFLWRDWDEAAPALGWVMLNPSTADATHDDQTIRRCRAFAARDGYGGIEVVNLFAFRATSPRALRTHPDPEGPENGRFLVALLEGEGPGDLVLAWGNARGLLPGTIARRASRTVRLLCLGRTQQGHPRHPARLPSATMLELWTASRNTEPPWTSDRRTCYLDAIRGRGGAG